MQRIIQDYSESINLQYPKYNECTAHCTELFTELFIYDYNDFPSEKKSMQYVKSVLKGIITYVFTNVGVKNYLKMIIGFFDLPEVKDFFTSAKIDTEKLYNIIDCIESRIIYWQGFEGVAPEKHLKHLLELLD